ncbi:hypothetical protein NL676_033203, partial [Syzygium grande]
ITACSFATFEIVGERTFGNQIQDSHDRIGEKFEFMAHHKGVHRFCFTNKSPYHETIDFDVHVGHFAYYDQHEKDGRTLLFFL